MQQKKIVRITTCLGPSPDELDVAKYACNLLLFETGVHLLQILQWIAMHELYWKDNYNTSQYLTIVIDRIPELNICKVPLKVNLWKKKKTLTTF